MKPLKLFAFFILVLFVFSSCSKETRLNLQSPDSKTSVKTYVQEGALYYEVMYNGAIVIQPSQLGLVRDDADFSENLSVTNVSEVETLTDSYTLKARKKKNYTYQANKQVITVTNTRGDEMQVVFQVSDNAVAFRYYFPESDTAVKKIEKELTQFAFDTASSAWLQPVAEAKSGWGQCNPSYEENYLMDISVGTPSPLAGWVFPALFKTGENWVLLSESAMDDYNCGTRLAVESAGGVYQIAYPDEREVIFNGELNPQSALPWASPWRTIAVGSLADVVESTIGTDVANPAIEGDFSWVKPGSASWSWVLLKDDFVTYPIQKKFIDYSAEMGWEYCLIDNYWDTKIGYKKIKALSDYAAEKGVKLILWYNSAGDWNTTPQTPQNMMLTEESRMAEFTKIKEMGISGVKVDFFGGDGQSVMKYYQDILKSAAKVGIMVNFHGCTLPRGWHRTYPNLMTMESVKGMEFATFVQENMDVYASHCAMLPFTRNVYDPMDLTPVCFGEVPNIKRITSNGFEIALSVLFYSGIQHFAEVPEVMLSMPDYVKEFMGAVPTAWDASKFIEGYPGEYVAIARKAGEHWYVAAINGQDTPQEIKMDLAFIDTKEGILIGDGETNRSFIQKKMNISDNANLTLTLKPNGGFVMKF